MCQSARGSATLALHRSLLITIYSDSVDARLLYIQVACGQFRHRALFRSPASPEVFYISLHIYNHKCIFPYIRSSYVPVYYLCIYINVHTQARIHSQPHVGTQDLGGFEGVLVGLGGVLDGSWGVLEESRKGLGRFWGGLGEVTGVS